MVLKRIRLRRGERLVAGARIAGKIRHVSPRLALGWTRGRLEFVDEPLGVIAENLSRYSRSPISVFPAAANLHLTTLVLSHHIPAWLNGLNPVLPVVVVRNNRGACVRLNASVITHQDNACHAPYTDVAHDVSVSEGRDVGIRRIHPLRVPFLSHCPSLDPRQQ